MKPIIGMLVESGVVKRIPGVGHAALQWSGWIRGIIS